MTSADSTVTALEPRPIRLEDYEVPAFLVDDVALRFDLRDGATTVTASLDMRRNAAHGDAAADLVLDGQRLQLLRVAVDGEELATDRYRVDDDHLTITGLPDAFSLQTEVRIEPEKNTALEGLYKSGPFYCTQCEAEGFRRITYYLDRPDVLARFTTTVVGDRAAHPVLLSNGNPIDSGELDDGRHFVTWEDPHKKPCYLFALVAGDLEHIEDHYTTAEGREVTLRIFTTRENIDKCDHAMRSLKSAMAWDEATYGLSCDLDHYMIVVTDDFNMGAMENKGLNIFNSKFVLARPDTATDADYLAIEGVIAHEYFHNWTGNRVTCRDWFQLSLKEGLTVFRDQRFSGDMNSPAIQRIGDVRALRTHQFPEDRGPMAHPVRPASVIEINNFYTVTVYEKGAEVVRMYQTLLGEDGFRRGMDLYFQRFDGMAVTCDDFRQAMADANGRDLSQFARWYSQAGTPRVRVRGEYDAATRRYTLHLSQSCPATPGLANDRPFHIPVAVGLLDANGDDIPLRGARPGDPGTVVLELVERAQSFVLEDVPVAPVPSLLRGFSAPVILERDVDAAELAFLMAHDSDAFCRWDAAQALMLACLQELIADHQAGRALTLPDHLRSAFGATLQRRDDDPALCAELMILPGESFLADQMDVVDVDAVHAVRDFVRKALAEAHREELLAAYRASRTGAAYSPGADDIARRTLQGACLGYLMATGSADVNALCRAQYDTADNMTEVVGALANLCHHGVEGHDEALEGFYQRWRRDPLVVDKWLAIQATSPRPDALRTVQALMGHEAFNLKNPNKVRALIGAFCGQNRVRFHAADGSGYRFLADQVLALDPLNPQIAARLAGILNHWRRFDAGRQAAMQGALQRMVASPGLSRDVFEIASKALA